MGQSINPIIFRFNNIFTWDSYWFTKQNYFFYLKEDFFIRKFFSFFFDILQINLSSCHILRKYNKIFIYLYGKTLNFDPDFSLSFKIKKSYFSKKKLKKMFAKVKTKKQYNKKFLKLNKIKSIFLKKQYIKLKKIFFFIIKSLKKILNCNIFIYFFLNKNIFQSAFLFNQFLIKLIKKNVLQSFFFTTINFLQHKLNPQNNKKFKIIKKKKNYVKNVVVCFTGCKKKAVKTSCTWIYFNKKYKLKKNKIMEKIDYNFIPCVLKQGIIGIKTWISFK